MIQQSPQIQYCHWHKKAPRTSVEKLEEDIAYITYTQIFPSEKYNHISYTIRRDRGRDREKVLNLQS